MNRLNLRATGDKRRLAFIRFSLSGMIFTFIGPAIFWLAYPIGDYKALAIAEISVHSLRFLTYRKLVFPVTKGYRVNLPRYILSSLPITLASVALISLLKNRLDRTGLTFAGASTSVFIGFLWSRYVYRRPFN